MEGQHSLSIQPAYSCEPDLLTLHQSANLVPAIVYSLPASQELTASLSADLKRRGRCLFDQVIFNFFRK
jgi:hypothetical protein